MNSTLYCQCGYGFSGFTGICVERKLLKHSLIRVKNQMIEAVSLIQALFEYYHWHWPLFSLVTSLLCLPWYLIRSRYRA